MGIRQLPSSGRNRHDRRPQRKVAERVLLSADQIEKTSPAKQQLERFHFGTATNAARLVNNAEWSRISMCCRFCARPASISPSLHAAEGIGEPPLESEEGISFTEFSYVILQARFLQVFDRTCSLQMGGGDRWGNITAGIDLIRVAGEEGPWPRVAAHEATAGTKFESGDRHDLAGSGTNAAFQVLSVLVEHR
jgi:tyrosyl-tRNA synthetase